MQQFTKEEIEKRSRIIGLCHQVLENFKEKKEELTPDWTTLFDTGKIEAVEELEAKTLSIIKRQIQSEEALKAFFKEEKEYISMEMRKHINYAELVKAHFQFGPQAAVEKEESDVEAINSSLDEHIRLLKEQEKILGNAKGSGQAAYLEGTLRGLLKKEFEILQNIQPFWHDWEVTVARIEGFVGNIETATHEEVERTRQDIQALLEQYHAAYSNNDRASQLGSELALNLYLNPTKEIQASGGVPIAVVNIDMTACNNLDESHKLGDALIEAGYEYLASQLKRGFSKIDGGQSINGRGVVTIWGRTRYKIVGVPKEEIVKALQGLHDTDHIIEELKKRQGSRFIGTSDEKEFLDLNTRMCVGYSIVKIEQAELFASKVRESAELRAQLSTTQTIDEKAAIEARRTELARELKQLEKAIATEIDEGLKTAAARAEFLEKTRYPELFEEKINDIQQKEEEQDIPSNLSIFYKQEERQIENDVLRKFPDILLFDGDTPQEYYGRNYIPEEEFEGIMIKRISHQIGLDLELSKQFFKVFESAGRPLTPQDKEKIHRMKEQFYLQVLQKRSMEKSYDLRMTRALREDDYDEIVAKMSYMEGPQIMTFIEVDGFNAFNKIFKPDSNDTYYHMILKNIFDTFDEHFNRGRSETERLQMRMTKQGDEIWISYPLRSERGEIDEGEHISFLRRVHHALVSRGEDALVVKNLQTASWIPWLPLDREMTKRHVEHASSLGQQITFVNNNRYTPTTRQGMSHIEITPENIEKMLSLESGLGGLGFGMKFRGNHDLEDMSKWKLIDNTRHVVGQDIFGPNTLKYSEMLFAETVKLGEGRMSVRAPTGRIIRLGTTMGYAGFTKRILIRDLEKTKAIRKALNESVEAIRKKKGRGEIWNLQKLSLTTEIIEKAA